MKKTRLAPLARRDLGELLRQVDLRRVVEIGPRHVQQLGRLVLDGGDDLRMAVAGRADGDAGGEVEEQVAVDVLDDRPAAALHRQRIDARVRRRHVLLVGRDQQRARGPGSSVRIHGTCRACIAHSSARLLRAMLPEKSYVIARREQAQFFMLEHAAQKTRPQKHFRL